MNTIIWFLVFSLKFMLLHKSIVHFLKNFLSSSLLQGYPIVFSVVFHSPVDEHLGYFQFGAITNKTAFQNHVSKCLHGHMLSFHLGVKGVDNMVGRYMYHLIETFLKWFYHCILPLTNCKYPFLLSILGRVTLVHFGHLNTCVIVSYCVLICILLVTSDLPSLCEMSVLPTQKKNCYFFN